MVNTQKLKWKVEKFKWAVKGLFKNKETTVCNYCEYNGCLKCRFAKFIRCTHLFRADKCFVKREDK